VFVWVEVRKSQQQKVRRCGGRQGRLHFRWHVQFCETYAGQLQCVPARYKRGRAVVLPLVNLLPHPPHPTCGIWMLLSSATSWSAAGQVAPTSASAAAACATAVLPLAAALCAASSSPDSCLTAV
jgi:hypothetical protein